MSGPVGVIRCELSHARCSRIAPLLPRKVGDPGRSGANNRLFVNGFWGLQSGAYWQALCFEGPVSQVNPASDKRRKPLLPER